MYFNLIMCFFTNKIDPNILIPSKLKKNESDIIKFNNHNNSNKSISTNTELTNSSILSSSTTKSHEDVIDEYNQMYNTKINIYYFNEYSDYNSLTNRSVTNRSVTNRSVTNRSVTT